MKRKLFNFVMPMVAIMLAIGGAFAFDTAEMETAFTPETGYIDGPTPCKVKVECDTEINPICTDVNGIQAFGIDAVTGLCTRTLYMPPQ